MPSRVIDSGRVGNPLKVLKTSSELLFIRDQNVRNSILKSIIDQLFNLTPSPSPKERGAVGVY